MRRATSGLTTVVTGPFGRVFLADMDYPVAEHAHPHVHLLFKVGGADRMFDVASQRCRLSDGQAILIGPWTPHSEPGPAQGTTTLLVLYGDRRWLAGRTAHALPGAALPPVTPEMRRLAHGLADRLATGAVAGVDALVGALLDQALAPRDRIVPARTGASEVDFRIRRAIDLIRADPAGHRNLADLAGSVGLSRSRFFEQFHRVTGISPRLYANAIWLEHAIEVLLSGERSIADVSDRLGFATQSHFCRFFREKVGMPPRDYRSGAIRWQ